MPHFVPALATAGVEALRIATETLADWQLRAPVDTSLTDPTALATELAAKLVYPEHLFDRLPDEAKQRVAEAVGVPPFERFAPPDGSDPDPEELPYPWERAVLGVLCRREPPPPPGPRASLPRHASALAWPELASSAAVRALAPESVEALAREIAARLGPGFTPLAPSRHGLPRVRSEAWQLDFVVVPGGRFAMGLSESEEEALFAAVSAVSPESAGYVRSVAAASRPVREVSIEPFLCAETPLLERHAAVLGVVGDPGNAHAVLRMEMDAVLAFVADEPLRLLSEAEAEWVARGGGSRLWPFTSGGARAWAEAAVSSPLDAMDHPFDVHALGWGEWLDDGWHPNYQDAPGDARAWEPRTDLQTVKGGALSLFPWQSGGEMMLAHAAFRERAGLADRHAVRLAMELPGR